MTDVIQTRGLTKHYRRVTALSDCTISVPEGRISALVGPTRSGQDQAASAPRRARRSGLRPPCSALQCARTRRTWGRSGSSLRSYRVEAGRS
jgi:ABC-type phosphate/phosphonate transport system ATPase subunit